MILGYLRVEENCSGCSRTANPLYSLIHLISCLGPSSMPQAQTGKVELEIRMGTRLLQRKVAKRCESSAQLHLEFRSSSSFIALPHLAIWLIWVSFAFSCGRFRLVLLVEYHGIRKNRAFSVILRRFRQMLWQIGANTLRKYDVFERNFRLAELILCIIEEIFQYFARPIKPRTKMPGFLLRSRYYEKQFVASFASFHFGRISRSLGSPCNYFV